MGSLLEALPVQNEATLGGPQMSVATREPSLSPLRFTSSPKTSMRRRADVVGKGLTTEAGRRLGLIGTSHSRVDRRMN